MWQKIVERRLFVAQHTENRIVLSEAESEVFRVKMAYTDIAAA